MKALVKQCIFNVKLFFVILESLNSFLHLLLVPYECLGVLIPQDLEMMERSPLVTPVVAAQQGEMIFNVENGVQIFFILPDGTVTSPSYPSFLAIFTFPGESVNTGGDLL